MANLFVRTSRVVPQGRQWGVEINGRIVEGGFFNRDAAVAACLWWQVNYREELPADQQDGGARYEAAQNEGLDY